MTPRISVLIPCYNAAPYIGETLKSVLAQTVENLEVIVVDDGSTDGSLDVIQPYIGGTLTLISQENGGAAAARNRAFRAATGDFVLYLDADDLIPPSHLAALSARLDDGSLSIAFSRWDRFHDDPDEATFPARATEEDTDGVSWLVADWSQGEPMTQCGMFLLPHRLLEQAGPWDEQLSLIDDFEFFARVIARCEGMRFAPDAALYYRSGLPRSLSGANGRQAAESAWRSISRGTEHLLAAEDSSRTRRACATIFQSFEYTYYPSHPDLRRLARRRVAELGGSDLEPVGPPRFHQLRSVVGWRMARRAQLLATRLGLNGAGRQQV